MNESLVTAADLLARLRERGTPLPYEFGVFITLEAVESTVDLPRVLAASDVQLSVDGAIRVSDSAAKGSPEAAARSAIALLGALLAASGPGVPPLLLRLVEIGPSNGEWNPARLRDELFTALVPLNRGASRRVLARMIRDVSRPATDASVHARSEPPLRATDDDLSSLLGDAVTHPTELPHDRSLDRATDRPADDSAESLAPVEELLEQSTEVVHVEALRASRPSVPPGPTSVAPASDEPPPESGELTASEDESCETLLAPTPARGPQDEEPLSQTAAPSVFSSSLEVAPVEPRRHTRPMSATIRPVVYLALAAGISLAAYRFGQLGSSATLVPMPPPENVAPAEVPAPPPPVAPAAPAAPAAVRTGSVVLTTTGGVSAQFLRFVGRTPLRIEDVRRGGFSELVVVDDGAPAVRLRIAPTSDWDDSVTPPLLELGFTRIDTTTSPVSFADLDLGAPAIDDSAPSVEAAARGAVRIVSTPRGAKVYRMLGTTDRLALEGVDPSEPLEFLVQAEGSFVEKVVIGPSDWQIAVEGAAPEARLQVVLRTRAR